MDRIEEETINQVINIIENSAYSIGQLQNEDSPKAQLIIRNKEELIKASRAKLIGMFIQKEKTELFRK